MTYKFGILKFIKSYDLSKSDISTQGLYKLVIEAFMDVTPISYEPHRFINEQAVSLVDTSKYDKILPFVFDVNLDGEDELLIYYAKYYSLNPKMGTSDINSHLEIFRKKTIGGNLFKISG